MSKKEKKNSKKEKKIFFKNNIYSLKYESLFNNKKYSDIQIKINDENYHLHKNILYSSSNNNNNI
jgi:hypothetical protein